MAVRSPEEGEAARARVLAEAPAASLEVVALDVASLASVRDGAAAIHAAHPRIDVLLNNAGVMGIPRRESVDGQELQLATNHLGHFALTALLLPALLRSDRCRVISITSTGRFLGRTVDPDDVAMRRRYDPWRSYGRAKLAACQLTIELDRRLARGGRAGASPRGGSGLRQHGHPGAQRAGGARDEPAVLRRDGRLVRVVARAALWAVSERETGVTFDVDAMVRAARRAPAGA